MCLQAPVPNACPRGMVKEFLLIYLDDITGLSSDFDSYLSHLGPVLISLWLSGLKLQPLKVK